MFSSLIGHESIKKRIIFSLQDPDGAFLFHGPMSVGKRTAAFLAAKYILCLKKSEECSCQSCKKFHNHPDFICVGRSDKIKIEDIDKVLMFSETSPFLSRNKVIVLDNADNITLNAANKLLKLLEEPPENFSFFLVTSYPDKILPTILSRCIDFKFNNVSREDLTNIIWKKLGFSLSESRVLGWIAFDSSIDVFSNAGLCLKNRKMVYDLLHSIKGRKLIDLLDFIEKVESDELYLFSDLLLLMLTDLLLLKSGIKDILNSDILEDLETLSKKVNQKALIAVVNSLSQIKRYSYLNINLKMAIKNFLIKNYKLFQV